MTRGAALNHAAHLATGDVLLFLHADTILPMGAAAAIAGALRDPDVIAGAFRLRFDRPGPLATLVTYNINLRSSLLTRFLATRQCSSVARCLRGQAASRIGA